MPLIKYSVCVVVQWEGMLLSYFAQEIKSQKLTSLILHKEKYKSEDLQCLYQEKKKLCMQCGGKNKNNRW